MRDTSNLPRLRRWLSAEARGEEAAAEAAFAALFGSLPRPAVPAGFAERVLARVATEAALLAPVPWRLERLALWLLAVCAGSLGLAPRWLPRAWELLAPQTWPSALAQALVHVARWVAALAPLWEGLARVVRWTALAAASPQALAAVALCGLLAATAGRFLLGLLDERSAGHAQLG